MDNWAQLMQNPKATYLKKFLAQVIPDKLHEYDDLLTRLGAILVTDNDLKAFANLINDVLVAAYSRSVEDYQTEFKKLNLNINLTLPNRRS